MNNPSLYLKVHHIGRVGSRNIIQKYFHLVSQNEDEEIAIIDIGSGPGNVTHDVLFPLFKNPIKKVVGIDISKEMVEFANATYGNENLSFEVLNIGNVVPERKLFLNINRIMKPNAQMLFSFVAQSILFDIYQSVWRRPEYTPYIDDVDFGQSCFQKPKEPVKEFQDIFENAGFQVEMIKIDEIAAKNKSLTGFKEFLISLNPYYDKIPDHLKESFILHHLEQVQRDAKVEGPNNYYMKFNIVVVYAKKNNFFIFVFNRNKVIVLK